MQPHGPPPHGYGYGLPPPPPSKGPSIFLVAGVCAAIVLFVAPCVVGGVIGYQRARDRAAAKSNPAKVTLSERATTKNGLLVAHYPSDFGAKKLDEATLIISRTVGTGDEFVTLGAIEVEKSSTDDTEEFARLMLVSVEQNIEAKNGTFVRGKSRDTKCLGKYPGVEFNPTFTLPGAGAYVGRACYFTHKERHYIVRYDVVKTHAESDRALLEKIVDATELKD